MAAKKQTSTKNNTKRSTKKPSAKKTAPARNTVSQSRQRTREVEDKRKMTAQSKAIWIAAAAALLFALVFVEGENIWNMVHNVLMGLFGKLAVLWPILLLYVAIVTAIDKRTNRRVSGNVALAVLTTLVLSACVYVYTATLLPQGTYFEELVNLYIKGTEGEVAGLFGGILGIPVALACGLSGAMIITTLCLIVILMFFFGITIYDIYRALKKPVKAVKENVSVVRQQQAQRREEHLKRQREEQQRLEKIREQRNYELESFSNTRSTSVFDEEEKLNITQRRGHKPKIDIPLGGEKSKTAKPSVNVAPSVPANAKENFDKIIKEINRPLDDTKSKEKPAASQVAQIITEKKSMNKKGAVGQKQPDPQTVPLNEEEAIAKEVEEGGKKEAAGKERAYIYPPVELLHPSIHNDDSDAMQELQDNGEKLITTLESFGVKAQIIDIARGPSVTRFELQPAPGVKISKITNLSDDIALNLAASGVRMEAPIPGKAAVGIEIPNRIVNMVSMRELIESREFTKAKSKLSVVLGKDISGEIMVTDLGKMPHLLIAGTTGSGKSVCVNSILISLLYKATPDEVKLLLIDPKMVEFSKYKSIPQLLIPVVSDAKKAAGALSWAVNEMLNRYKTFAAYNVRDIGSYNKMVENYDKIRAAKTPEELESEPLVTEDNLPAPTDKLPRIVIAIDELADLMMAAPNEVEDSICRLAQMARAAGMHLVIATQRPSVNVITGVIKANIPSRISLKVSSQIDSRTILDVGGAEKLIGRGDMLFSPVGAPKPLRIQGCYASDEEIENVTGYVKRSYKSDYDEQVVEEIEKIAAQEISKNDKSSAGTPDENADPMLEEAIKLVVEAGQASTSLLQRRLRLGYARAGRLVDEMEQMGIVGPHEGSKSRKVLITYQEWLERNNLTGE